MSIEVLEEAESDVDPRRLMKLSRFVLDRLRVHPQAELCIMLVDEQTIAELNGKWMGHEGVTDVLAWPMDELRPGHVNDEPEEGVLGDLALCPSVAQRQAEEARGKGQAGYTLTDEADLLTVHGILHLLGYDHAEPEEHREMFGLQNRLLAEWQGVLSGAPVE
ncbi:MAG: putative rRNA maturation factor [Nocardioidaceae bacterium]|nr:putative rRNA maturation factor [Nocardioidaceae bacterium]